ncbi:copper chaperone PCu(A)C [Alkalisalibacterium limincola]|uniref:Copper chaperone PCu(A)C n=1 Tax=Alkalisalibacterium limincola TaxID=2699169 RepID=A0A5C8KQ96_9GAMM|nr:copper chaperone PCu(A)C [Alkalisalibacterium limincola]
MWPRRCRRRRGRRCTHAAGGGQRAGTPSGCPGGRGDRAAGLDPGGTAQRAGRCGLPHAHQRHAVDDRLLEVRSEAAERVEIHEMVSAGDGTMQMREVEGGLPLPGGISVDLRPGGLHLMFFGPDTARWQAGEGIPVTLVFEGVGEREARMDVYAPGEAPADGALRMRGPDAAGDDEEHHDHHGH